MMRRNIRPWQAVVGLLLLVSFCSYSDAYAQRQQGMASFYAREATGSITANGERLHHDSMTCAHRTLPFGTLLSVTHLGNDRQVIVRVNDRGPYVAGRIIDLSWGAALKLGMLGQGIAKVHVEPAYTIVIPKEAPPMRIVLPNLEPEIIELPDTLRAIWQEDELIIHKKKMVKKKSSVFKKEETLTNKRKRTK